MPQDDLATTTPLTNHAAQTILNRIEGDRSTISKLLPLVYDELKRVAKNYVRQENTDHTLQATALVNEAFLRMQKQTLVSYNDRAHFFRTAAQVMRHILVDHARAKLTQKRGGDMALTSLDKTAMNYAEHVSEQLHPGNNGSAIDGIPESEIDFLALDAALDELRARSPRQAQVVELRFFGGLSIEEAAKVMGVSDATVKREWAVARLFLKDFIESRR